MMRVLIGVLAVAACARGPSDDAGLVETDDVELAPCEGALDICETGGCSLALEASGTAVEGAVFTASAPVPGAVLHVRSTTCERSESVCWFAMSLPQDGQVSFRAPPSTTWDLDLELPRFDHFLRSGMRLPLARDWSVEDGLPEAVSLAFVDVVLDASAASPVVLETDDGGQLFVLESMDTVLPEGDVGVFGAGGLDLGTLQARQGATLSVRSPGVLIALDVQVDGPDPFTEWRPEEHVFVRAVDDASAFAFEGHTWHWLDDGSVALPVGTWDLSYDPAMEQDVTRVTVEAEDVGGPPLDVQMPVRTREVTFALENTLPPRSLSLTLRGIPSAPQVLWSSYQEDLPATVPLPYGTYAVDLFAAAGLGTFTPVSELVVDDEDATLRATLPDIAGEYRLSGTGSFTGPVEPDDGVSFVATDSYGQGRYLQPEQMAEPGAHVLAGPVEVLLRAAFGGVYLERQWTVDVAGDRYERFEAAVRPVDLRFEAGSSTSVLFQYLTRADDSWSFAGRGRSRASRYSAALTPGRHTISWVGASSLGPTELYAGVQEFCIPPE